MPPKNYMIEQLRRALTSTDAIRQALANRDRLLDIQIVDYPTIIERQTPLTAQETADIEYFQNKLWSSLQLPLRFSQRNKPMVHNGMTFYPIQQMILR